MKQEESILQWASHLMLEQVPNLKAIQEVRFVKHLLWRIDDAYFAEWEEGAGQESYSQVLQLVGKYFKEEIGTDISQHLQGLNVYRNVREVWQLVLGIAIKGNNRNNNIALIFELNHAVQAELVKIVTDIIDKFGQNTAAIDADQPEQDHNQTNDRQAIIELATENEMLRDQCHRLEGELLKEKQERAASNAQRKELQGNLQMMRLEKLAFLEVMANANRSNSRIFEEGETVLEAQANLSELAQDIVQFIRAQRKKVEAETQRSSLLEDQVKQLRENIRKCVEQNEIYLSKLADLTAYQREIQALRGEVNEKFEQNLYLLEQISSLQDEKANLINALQRRALDQHTETTEKLPQSQQTPAQTTERRNTEQRLNRKATIRNQEVKGSFNSSQGGQQSASNHSELAVEREQATKRQMDDELREPQLRNKLQREVTFLKKTISSLNRQIETLKRTNEALQRSAKSFMDSNQKVIGKWEEEYETLLTKMGALTKINQDLTEENMQQNSEKQELASKLKARQVQEQKRLEKEKQLHEQEDSIDSRSNSEMSSNQPIEIIINKPQQKQEQTNREAIQKSKRDKVALWDEIVKKLREIIREGKTKQLAYENNLQSLRNQNFKLLELLRNRNNKNQESNEIQPPERPSIGMQDSYFAKLQRVQSEDMHDLQDSKLRLNHPRLSYVEIQEGQELDESAVSRLTRQKSNYYNVTSKIVDEFTEKKLQVSHIHHDQFQYNLNQRLTASIRESFDGLHARIADHDHSGSADLQRRMQEEAVRIAGQYQQLNSNYQKVFSKLHIYTQNLKEKESVKLGYQQVLQQISKAQSQVKASHQAEIVKLRIMNQALTHQVTQNIIEKQGFVECIGKLSTSISEMKARAEEKHKLTLQQMERVLLQANNRYNSSMKDPLAFLESCLEVSKEEGQLQKFYRLYLKQKQMTKQLNEQIDLLSSVLLEYRNMIIS